MGGVGAGDFGLGGEAFEGRGGGTTGGTSSCGGCVTDLTGRGGGGQAQVTVLAVHNPHLSLASLVKAQLLKPIYNISVRNKPSLSSRLKLGQIQLLRKIHDQQCVSY